MGVIISLNRAYQINNHILLSPLCLNDAQDVYEAVQQNRQLLSKYLYWADHVIDECSATKYIANRIDSRAPNNCWFKITNNSDFGGVFGVKSIDPATSIAEVGYWLKADLHGRGIIRQIIERLIPELKKAGSKFLEFRCLSDNHASINVAQKTGAKLVRVEPNFMTIDDKQQALLYFHATL